LEQAGPISWKFVGFCFEKGNYFFNGRKSFSLRRGWQVRDREKVEEEARGQVPIIVETTGRFEEKDVFLCDQPSFFLSKPQARLEVDINSSLNGISIGS